jgi:type I restriction enzyme, S subunit
MIGWRYEPFDNVIADESGGNLKTPQSKFLPAGRYAIVDQGKELVAGYSDDESRLCRARLPVIVFGDHTRCFKYVDFPFCMGADGVKVLRPKIEADVKYLYHYLRQLRMTEGGYDRHFKYLKRSRIALPPLPEQRRIAAILDKADALRAKRRATLAQLETLSQSIFLDMFGDPATNLKGWPIGEIADLLESAAYGVSEKSAASGEYPVLRMNNITRTGETDLSNLKYMDLHESMRERYLVQTGDVLFNRTNSAELVGKTAVFREARAMAYAGYLIRLRVNRDNDPEYLATFLNTAYMKRVLRGMCKSIIGMANINAKELQAIRIPRPPHGIQRRFAERLTSVEKLKSVHRDSLTEFESLFASLQHRAFSGEL